MNKIFSYAIVIIVFGILLFTFVQMPKNQETTRVRSNLEIYDAIDISVNGFLSQRPTLYDAVDNSVGQFLNSNGK